MDVALMISDDVWVLPNDRRSPAARSAVRCTGLLTPHSIRRTCCVAELRRTVLVELRRVPELGDERGEATELKPRDFAHYPQVAGQARAWIASEGGNRDVGAPGEARVIAMFEPHSVRTAMAQSTGHCAVELPQASAQPSE